MPAFRFRLSLAVSLIASFSFPAAAQSNRIGRVDRARTVALAGHVRPAASAANDRGRADDSLSIPGITLMLKPSAAQKADLAQLLAAQQDPSSPQFHKWVTPEQFADRFTVTAADLDKIRAWLEGEGFTITAAARSRNSITFNATAAQIRNSFKTEVHQYSVNGATHFANASNPQIPADLADVVAGFRGLDNFRWKPHIKVAHPQFNSGGSHELAPDDFATIYNVAPLYQAGVDGTGQSLVIVGQTSLRTTDLTTFRTKFNLPTLNLQQVLVPGRPNPGLSNGDLQEANLDIEWSGAVARNAQIIYVYSDDVVQAAIYAIDNNLAPVLSMSYGGCEIGDLADLPMLQTLAQQANAQGMTWFAASGDTGAADCESMGDTVAQNGLAVDAPGSIPEVTSMGGTEFSEASGNYWNTTNSANSASALSYIPEVVWNDTATFNELAAGGGGASIFFPRPAWQAASGLPTDNYRRVPDISLNASAGHVSYYTVYLGSATYFGGTSAAAPTMAGIATLLNHYLVSTGAQQTAGLGNINPMLYRLAASSPNVFHDVISGNNAVPCVAGSPDCVNGSVGFKAGAGYDSATGLGSVDAFALAHSWSAFPPSASAVTVSIDANPVFETAANSNRWTFHLTLSEEAGVSTTLTGMTIDGVSYDSQLATLFGKTAISARGSITAAVTAQNIAFPKTVLFTFTGVDASGANWTSSLSIPFSGPQLQLTIGGVANAASGAQSYAPGMIISVYGTALGAYVQSANYVPLPEFLGGFEATVNGVAAPIYYVSPNQVNLQIPYETQPGQATLTVGNPYVNFDHKITVAPAAPGIFTFADGTINPFPRAARNDTITLFITGEGQVSPSLATGTAPNARNTSQLPKPVLPVTVTVGGAVANVTFSGIPNGLVGVTQVNFTIPTNAATGLQPVVVTVGSASSLPANITITQ